MALYDRKLEVSEGVIRERESEPEKKKPPRGYEQHPADDKAYEVFGLKNSFDDISVSADEKGRLTLAVSSEKGCHAPTLDATKKKLRGSRRRTVYEHFGEFFTDPAARGRGAFAFRTRKNLSETRILRDFKEVSKKHTAPSQLEAAPFLTLDEDKRQLSELRSKGSENLDERLAAERTIQRKTELENRFIRKLRIARRRTIARPAPAEPEPIKQNEQVTDNDDDSDNETDTENDV